MGGIVVYRVHAAIAEDGEILAEADFRDLDAGEKIRFLRAIEHVGQGGENGVVVVGVIPELRDRLRDQHVEPV